MVTKKRMQNKKLATTLSEEKIPKNKMVFS